MKDDTHYKWTIFKGHGVHIYYLLDREAQDTADDDISFPPLHDTLGPENDQRIYCNRDQYLNNTESSASVWIATGKRSITIFQDSICKKNVIRTIPKKSTTLISFEALRGSCVLFKLAGSIVRLPVFSLVLLDLLFMEDNDKIELLKSYVIPSPGAMYPHSPLNTAYQRAFIQFAVVSSSSVDSISYLYNDLPEPFSSTREYCTCLRVNILQKHRGTTAENGRIMILLARSHDEDDGCPFPGNSATDPAYTNWEGKSEIIYQGKAKISSKGNTLTPPQNISLPDALATSASVRIYRENRLPPDDVFMKTRQEVLKEYPFISFDVDEFTAEDRTVSLEPQKLFNHDTHIYDDPTEEGTKKYLNISDYKKQLCKKSKDLTVQILSEGYQNYTLSGLGLNRRRCLILYSDSFGKGSNRMLKTLIHEFGHVFGLAHKCGCRAIDQKSACVMNYPASWLLKEYKSGNWWDKGKAKIKLAKWQVAGVLKGHSFCADHLEFLIKKAETEKSSKTKASIS